MRRQDFYYDLPEELIAQVPLADRSASRLLVLDKKTGATEHKHFRDLLQYLRPHDCLILNDTRVMPARLLGEREDTGTHVELLLLRRCQEGQYGEGMCWEVLVHPGRRVRPGHRLTFGDGRLRAEVLSIVEGGNRIVRFDFEGVFEEVLDQLGEMPLPPYIHEKLQDRERYQTVYAKEEGSAAAPTAGLHFTQELLDEIRAAGVEIGFLTLHVGLGTFRPVKVEDISEHVMHSEYCEVTPQAVEALQKARAAGGRIVAVGTTSVRTLESASASGKLEPFRGWTDIFITPGYTFKSVDALITNFHLPGSTLIMLVSALMGREQTLHAYKIAVDEGYRFFSFGDAMLIE